MISFICLRSEVNLSYEARLHAFRLSLSLLLSSEITESSYVVCIVLSLTLSRILICVLLTENRLGDMTGIDFELVDAFGGRNEPGRVFGLFGRNFHFSGQTSDCALDDSEVLDNILGFILRLHI